MKPHRVNLVGKIDNKGKLLIANMDELREFGKKWKGQTVIMTADVNPGGPSKALKGYYFNKIVPDFQTIFNDTGDRMSLMDVDIRLRSMCPIMVVEIPMEEAGGFALERIKTIYEISSSETEGEISSSEMVEFIEHLRIIAAQDYHYQIEDPKRF